MSAEKHTILYAEDDADDVFIIQQAFQQSNREIEIVHAVNGVEALEKLNEMHDQGVLPCLIILDMNMPGMDGRQTLLELKKSEIFSDIPVAIFTTSSNRSDMMFAENFGAKFMTKPLVYSEFGPLANSFLNLCKFQLGKPA